MLGSCTDDTLLQSLGSNEHTKSGKQYNTSSSPVTMSFGVSTGSQSPAMSASTTGIEESLVK